MSSGGDLTGLPENWSQSALSELCSIVSGGTPPKSDRTHWGGEVPWVSGKDLKSARLFDVVDHITKDAAEAYSRIAPHGSVLALVRGMGLAKGFPISLIERPMAFNQDLKALIPNRYIDGAFLLYALRFAEPSVLQNISNAAHGTKRLSQDDLNNVVLPVPPLDEQRSIVLVLDAARAARELAQTTEEKSAELKRAAMRELFTRGLRGEAQKETEIGPVPESWDVSTLGALTTLERGRFLHRPRNEPRFYGGDTPFVQTGDVVRSDGRIREYTQTLNADGVAISRVFPTGTILITIAANIGFTGILQFDSACPDSLIAITPNEQIDTEFLEYWLQTQQPEMDRLAPKGTQKNINIQFLSPWPVPVPPMDEQRDIIEVLSVIDRKIELHRQKRAVLDELFKALLHKLMTGEIRVADLDLSALDRPAAVSTVIPAQAGIQGPGAEAVAPCSSQGEALDPRFRGGDEGQVEVAQ